MTDAKTIISVIIASRDPDHVPHLPDGADEVLVVAGPGKASAQNAGAKLAEGNLLVFVDDDVTFEGSFYQLHYVPADQHWWTVRRWIDGTGDAFNASKCFATSLIASVGGWNGSVGPLQAVRRWAFESVGGYDVDHPLEDLNLSKKLHQRGLQLHRIQMTGVIQRRFASYEETFARFARMGAQRFGPHPVRRWVPVSKFRLQADLRTRIVSKTPYPPMR